MQVVPGLHLTIVQGSIIGALNLKNANQYYRRDEVIYNSERLLADQNPCFTLIIIHTKYNEPINDNSMLFTQIFLFLWHTNPAHNAAFHIVQRMFFRVDISSLNKILLVVVSAKSFHSAPQLQKLP
mgnify:CR=1 FL=1